MNHSPFSEHPLRLIIAALSAKNIELGRYRNDYLALKASKDHFEATLTQNSPGQSQVERSTNAKATREWCEFHKKLARAESEYEFVKLQFKILELEFNSQYLELKLDAGLIKKGVDG